MTNRLLKFFECHKPGSCAHFSYFMCWNEPFARRTLDSTVISDSYIAIYTHTICRQTDAPLMRVPSYRIQMYCFSMYLYVMLYRQLLVWNRVRERERKKESIPHVKTVYRTSTSLSVVEGHVRICVRENIFEISRARRSHKFLGVRHRRRRCFIFHHQRSGFNLTEHIIEKNKDPG